MKTSGYASVYPADTLLFYDLPVFVVSLKMTAGASVQPKAWKINNITTQPLSVYKALALNCQTKKQCAFKSINVSLPEAQS